MLRRMLPLLIGVLILACIGLVTPGFAGKTPIDPVTVTFTDASGDGIQSDSPSSPSYVDGQSDVSAFLGDQLNLHTDSSKQNPAGRTLGFIFGPELTGNPSLPPPPPDGNYPAYLWNNGWDFVTGTTSLRTMGVGDFKYFALWIDFYTPDGTRWEIRFNPAGTGNSPVKVTRFDANTWYIVTDGNSICRLVHYKGGLVVDHGQFQMPFSLTFWK